MGTVRVSLLVVFCSIVTIYVWRKNQDNLPPIVEGFFQPEFMDIALTLKQAMESGREQGAAFAVYHEGELIIDMWAGYADREAHRRWRNQTTTLTFDCTKGAMAILVASLVDMHQVDYSSLIGDHWPCSKGKGKQLASITLESLLSHQAGLPYLSKSISLRDLQSGEVDVYELLCDEQKPVWEPGSQFGYHELTLGLILDHLIPKVDPHGRSAEEAFDEVIAKPFGIEYSINLKQNQFGNTARLHRQSYQHIFWQYLTSWKYLQTLLSYTFNSESDTYKAVSFLREYLLPIKVFNNPELREITLSSISGTGTARGLAKLYSYLATGGVHDHTGQKLLSEEAVTKLTTPVVEGLDPVTGRQVKYTMGLQVYQNPLGEPTYGHAGLGGQIALADPKHRLSMAYVTNHLSIYRHGDDPRFIDLQKAVYKNLDRYIARKRNMRT